MPTIISLPSLGHDSTHYVSPPLHNGPQVTLEHMSSPRADKPALHIIEVPISLET